MQIFAFLGVENDVWTMLIILQGKIISSTDSGTFQHNSNFNPAIYLFKFRTESEHNGTQGRTERRTMADMICVQWKGYPKKKDEESPKELGYR